MSSKRSIRPAFTAPRSEQIGAARDLARLLSGQSKRVTIWKVGRAGKVPIAIDAGGHGLRYPSR